GDADEFAPFFLKVTECDFGKRFQRRTKTAFKFSGAVSDSAHLALVSRQEDADLVRLLERVGAKEKRFGLVERHKLESKYIRSRRTARVLRANFISDHPFNTPSGTIAASSISIPLIENELQSESGGTK